MKTAVASNVAALAVLGAAWWLTRPATPEQDNRRSGIVRAIPEQQSHAARDERAVPKERVEPSHAGNRGSEPQKAKPPRARLGTNCGDYFQRVDQLLKQMADMEEMRIRIEREARWPSPGWCPEAVKTSRGITNRRTGHPIPREE